jgi:hypothetical protein
MQVLLNLSPCVSADIGHKCTIHYIRLEESCAATLNAASRVLENMM